MEEGFKPSPVQYSYLHCTCRTRCAYVALVTLIAIAVRINARVGARGIPRANALRVPHQIQLYIFLRQLPTGRLVRANYTSLKGNCPSVYPSSTQGLLSDRYYTPLPTLFFVLPSPPVY